LALGGHGFIFRHNDQLIVRVSTEGMAERPRGQGGVYGGSCLFIWGGKLTTKKYKKKYTMWP
jgi:hypothetical protein